jgi:hypothetical protein
VLKDAEKRENTHKPARTFTANSRFRLLFVKFVWFAVQFPWVYEHGFENLRFRTRFPENREFAAMRGKSGRDLRENREVPEQVHYVS